MSFRNSLSILAIVSLCIPIPHAPAAAQFRDGALAAGIIGAAIGSAIIMNGQRRAPSYQRSHRRTARARAPQSSREAKNTRDRFASASAPADYAKPVSNAR